MKDLISKSKVKSGRQRYLTSDSGAHVYVHMCTCDLHTVHMYVHMCTRIHINTKEHNLRRHVSLYSWGILMGSSICCLNNTIKSILPLCLFPLLTLLPLVSPHSPPSLTFCFYAHIDHLHLSPYRRATLEELQTNIDSSHGHHSFQDPPRILLKNSHWKQLEGSPGWEALQFCSIKTSWECCSRKGVSTCYTPSKWNTGKNPISLQVVKRSWCIWLSKLSSFPHPPLEFFPLKFGSCFQS